jgi:hypothetical protein
MTRSFDAIEVGPHGDLLDAFPYSGHRKISGRAVYQIRHNANRILS